LPRLSTSAVCGSTVVVYWLPSGRSPLTSVAARHPSNSRRAPSALVPPSGPRPALGCLAIAAQLRELALDAFAELEETQAHCSHKALAAPPSLASPAHPATAAGLSSAAAVHHAADINLAVLSECPSRTRQLWPSEFFGEGHRPCLVIDSTNASSKPGAHPRLKCCVP
jgi:hypothetical protein